MAVEEADPERLRLFSSDSDTDSNHSELSIDSHGNVYEEVVSAVADAFVEIGNQYLLTRLILQNRQNFRLYLHHTIKNGNACNFRVSHNRKKWIREVNIARRVVHQWKYFVNLQKKKRGWQRWVNTVLMLCKMAIEPKKGNDEGSTPSLEQYLAGCGIVLERRTLKLISRYYADRQTSWVKLESEFGEVVKVDPAQTYIAGFAISGAMNADSRRQPVEKPLERVASVQSFQLGDVRPVDHLLKVLRALCLLFALCLRVRPC